jgi:hypothetical protein
VGACCRARPPSGRPPNLRNQSSRGGARTRRTSRLAAERGTGLAGPRRRRWGDSSSQPPSSPHQQDKPASFGPINLAGSGSRSSRRRAACVRAYLAGAIDQSLSLIRSDLMMAPAIGRKRRRGHSRRLFRRPRAPAHVVGRRACGGRGAHFPSAGALENLAIDLRSGSRSIDLARAPPPNDVDNHQRAGAAAAAATAAAAARSRTAGPLRCRHHRGVAAASQSAHRLQLPLGLLLLSSLLLPQPVRRTSQPVVFDLRASLLALCWIRFMRRRASRSRTAPRRQWPGARPRAHPATWRQPTILSVISSGLPARARRPIMETSEACVCMLV